MSETVKNKPPTEDQLENAERWAIECLTPSTLGSGGPRLAECVLGLVEEVRRLRAEVRLSYEDDENATVERVQPEQEIGGLQSQLNRLRSDEWLEKAAEEIAQEIDVDGPGDQAVSQALAILRKHRDRA